MIGKGLLPQSVHDMTVYALLPSREKMSRNNYEASPMSSGDEDEGRLIIDTRPIVTPRKAIRRRKRRVESDEENDSTKIVEMPDSQPLILEDPPKKKKNTIFRNKPDVVDENAWQKAMDVAVEILVSLKVDIKNLTLLPDAGTLECFKKGVNAWMLENKIYVPLTYSTQATLVLQIARFFFSFVIRYAGLTCEWNPSGCVIWDHKSTQGQTLKCLHGCAMLTRDHIVEMDMSSEAAQKALKETPDKAVIAVNKWGRSIVQLKSGDAKCCSNDAMVPTGTFSAKSCGMFFTDGKKMVTALEQIMALQKACYPKMGNSLTHLLMPVECECNWGNKNCMLLGRQLCKMTPFALTAASNMDVSKVSDPKLLATINHPVVLVFQCCNPVYRNSKASPQKNCDFKISAPDVMAALQVAKQMWFSIMKVPAPVIVPEFKWSPRLQYQTTLLPIAHCDSDDRLF
ncbi:DBP [Polar bear adenovirus 1]|uniref:DNA-binding protein n=1 Tax=Polar bear adenovirus 1 TaxID=2250215 RepID=A0A345S508_9ADEN|nr:DBP [Polar bear adenovirus 1]AXI68661.1 DBP [Polar bear adenovirus 1]